MAYIDKLLPGLDENTKKVAQTKQDLLLDSNLARGVNQSYANDGTYAKMTTSPSEANFYKPDFYGAPTVLENGAQSKSTAIPEVPENTVANVYSQAVTPSGVNQTTPPAAPLTSSIPTYTPSNEKITVYLNGQAKEIDRAMLDQFTRAGYTTSPTTPADATVGDVYGYIPKEDQALTDARSVYAKSLQDTGELTEDEIRNKVTERFQGQIDAQNRYYAEKLKEEALQGQNRIGSGTAIQARRGLIGSDFGSAQKQGIISANTEAQNAIRAEQAAVVANIMGQARTSVVEEAKAKAEAKKQGAEAYVNFLAGEADRKTQKVATTAQNLLNNNVDLTGAELEQLASELGVSVEELQSKYNELKTATTEDAGFNVVSAGSSVYDDAGNLLGTAPETVETPDELEVMKKQLEIAKLQNDIVNSTDAVDKQIKQAQLTKLLNGLNDDAESKMVEPFKSTIATTGREAVSTMLGIAEANPEIFGRTAAMPLPQMLRSDAYRNYEAQLNKLKGNIIPAALTAMREASTTGGALGQVSDKEGDWLSAALGGLYMTQSPAQVIDQLKQIDAHLADWQTVMAQYESENPGSTGGDGEFSW